MKEWLKKPASIAAIAVGGLILAILVVKLQPEMAHSPQTRPSVDANFIEIKSHQVRPEITGFGTIKPDLNLIAKAEVSGRVTYLNPQLKKGEIFSKDTLLVKIDDKDYLLQLKQAEADVLAQQANLKEMELTIENNDLELKLAKEKLKVRDKEYKRLAQLRKSGSVSQSKLDAEKQNLLQQQQEVQQLTNKKTTLPSDLEVMKAQLAIAESKLEKSQRDLTRTEIRIPFNGRISKVSVEAEQYVGVGNELFSAAGLNKVVVNAQFPIDQFSKFAQSFDKQKINLKDNEGYSNMAQMLASLGLSASVEIVNSGYQPWEARVERFSDDLDPQSRTIGVTVSIEGNYKDIEPGKKPPLLEGMYTKVSLLGPASDYLILPRFAIHGSEVYLINEKDELERKKIKLSQFKGNLALFKNGLQAGDRLITSDLFPVVNGMKITPVEDSAAQNQVAAWAGVKQ